MGREKTRNDEKKMAGREQERKTVEMSRKTKLIRVNCGSGKK